MIKYNTLNKKLSNSQLNKLKSEIKNDTEVTLNINFKSTYFIKDWKFQR